MTVLSMALFCTTKKKKIAIPTNTAKRITPPTKKCLSFAELFATGIKALCSNYA